MFVVYCLSSLIRDYLYAGQSKNFPKRFNQHQQGKNKTTRAYRPFEVLHREEYESRKDARKREKYLKTGIGKEFLKFLRNKK